MVYMFYPQNPRKPNVHKVLPDHNDRIKSMEFSTSKSIV